MRKRGLTALTRLDVVDALPGEYGQRVTVLPWWRELIGAIDNPTYVFLLALLVRQAGKSQCAMSVAVSELLTRPRAYVLYLAAAEHQASAVFERKLRAPLAALLRSEGIAPGAVTFTKRGVSVPSLGSELEVIPANAGTTPGRSPSLLIVDEARDIPDAVFTALVPSVVGAGGKVLVVGTPGAPRGFFYELVESAATSPEIWLHHGGSVNENPSASQSTLSFLRRKLGSLFPAAMRRELEGEFADDGDSFLRSDLIDAAVDDSLIEVSSSDRPAFGFLDLSRKRDLTSLVIATVERPRKPGAGDHLSVGSVQTWDPKASPTGEVDFGRCGRRSMPCRVGSRSCAGCWSTRVRRLGASCRGRVSIDF